MQPDLFREQVRKVAMTPTFLHYLRLLPEAYPQARSWSDLTNRQRAESQNLLIYLQSENRANSEALYELLGIAKRTFYDRRDKGKTVAEYVRLRLALHTFALQARKRREDDVTKQDLQEIMRPIEEKLDTVVRLMGAEERPQLRLIAGGMGGLEIAERSPSGHRSLYQSKPVANLH